MRKRLAIAGVVVATSLFPFSGIASAWFTNTATCNVTGRTGNVRITTVNVTLSYKFQPGDTQYKWIKVYNAGRCPVKIYQIRIFGKPGFLGVRVTPGIRGRINAGGSYSFKLYVWMPPGVGNWAQNKPINFQIKFFSQNLPTAH